MSTEVVNIDLNANIHVLILRPHAAGVSLCGVSDDFYQRAWSTGKDRKFVYFFFQRLTPLQQ